MKNKVNKVQYLLGYIEYILVEVYLGSILSESTTPRGMDG